MPSYTYNQNIPAASNLLSDDQPNMATNTNSIFNLLGGDSTVDMIGFGDSDGGWHRQLTYVVQGSAPGSSSGQARTYSKTSSGNSEIFLQRDNVATEIQLTRGTPSAAANGYTFLPGGLLLQWGNTTAPTAITFPVSFTSAVYSVNVTVRSASPAYCSVGVPSITGVSVNIQSGAGNQVIYWMAIGV